jgi:hypothetical protein
MSLKDKFVNMLASFADDQIPGEPEIHGEKQISPQFLGQEKTVLEMMLDAPVSRGDGYCAGSVAEYWKLESQGIYRIGPYN